MRRSLIALLTVVALSACSDDTGSQAPGPSARPGACVPVVPSGAAASADPALGRLALPCFTDGGDVRLAAFGRPAVLNLWASWCAPCREELPQVEGYYRRAGGSVLVIGVITGTGRPVARDIVAELGLTFPMLYDRDLKLLAALGLGALPATAFVDASGRVAHLEKRAVDAASLRQLGQRHLGVAVPA